MNSSEWSHSYSYNTNYQYDRSVGNCLNYSSGYESTSNDSSLIEHCLSYSSSIILKENLNVIENYSIDIEELTEYNGNDRHQKRRVLSRSQRDEANRRERNRMKIINQAYEHLRNVLPFKKGYKRQKMSRMDTVNGAIKYIQSLLKQLDEMQTI